MKNNQAFIRMKNVSYRFGKQVIIKQQSLALEKGVSYALIGQSGIGKTTLLRLFAGFTAPESGTIFINNERLMKPRVKTGFLFQDLGLFPWQTVFDAVKMPLQMYTSINKKDLESRVLEWLRELQIEHCYDKYPHELSGGQKQRVALARTLIVEPDFVLMDEPTSAIDAMTKESIQALILAQHQREKTTMLFVTHDIEEAVFLGEVILIMRENGQITQIRNPIFGNKDNRQTLAFYQACINVRKLINLEMEPDEIFTHNR
ncbi:Sulfate/thiosulfate import ATP-binding protein CysA [Paraliobacillus sp. PM-2]|uniref:ABC transporter ATP-binding protein n=1 Tax=Paraliobacillus sp. PM-2 TaxID=1462524 RepID=UPI00061BF69F|nr:ABC transporter ATP-binding protein [Paraliobacillus sp. PM-2]CQR45964.1 Sulfate/thiosulfate import ATP-binding protein CysA [Paraliobacillus sp. PM-2]